MKESVPPSNFHAAMFSAAIKQTVFITAFISCSLVHSQTTWNIESGWNLLGNHSIGPLEVATLGLNNPDQTSSIWTWNNATSRWAFFTPSLTNTELSAYAKSQDFDVLSTIAPKQGFWVNAKSAFTVTSPWRSNSDPGLGSSQLESSDLRLGWNLVGGTGKEYPSNFTLSMKSTLNKAGSDITSVWAWDTAFSRWHFLSPALDAQGGSALSDYARINGYALFSSEVSDAKGLWINVGTYVPPPPAYTSLFKRDPILLPDLRAKYDSLCGSNVSVQNALAANLSGHLDGKKDFVFNLWCSQIPVGIATTAPTVNGLIAITQQPDGTFLDETKKYFGVEMVDLIGVANRAVVHDFNNDGRDDIVLAVTGEDGRALPEGDTSSNRQNVFITSNGTGAYKVERLGKYSYNHQIQLKDNAAGGKDVVTENIGYGGSRSAWRFNGEWKELSGYDWLNFVAVFFDRKVSGIGSTKALTQSTVKGGLDLFTSSGNDAWTKRSTWSFPNVSTVPMRGWNGDLGTATMMTLEGKDYVSIVFELGCELKKAPTEDSIAIMALNTMEMIGGYKVGSIVEPDSPFKLVTKLMAFSPTNDVLTNLPLTINNEAQSSQFFAISCQDVNNDGFQDITVMPWGNRVVPSIYLNDKSGRFGLVDPGKLPLPSATFSDNSMIYVDVDGDGIRDLLYWPTTRVEGEPVSVRYEIYKGVRNLNSEDLKQ